jgi:hypothetical protein
MNRDFDYILFLNGETEPLYYFDDNDKLVASIPTHAPRFLIPRGLGAFVELQVTHFKSVTKPSISGDGYLNHPVKFDLPIKHQILLNTDKLANYLTDALSKMKLEEEGKLGALFTNILKLKRLKKILLLGDVEESQISLGITLYHSLVESVLLKNEVYKEYGYFGRYNLKDRMKIDNVYVCSSCQENSWNYDDLKENPIRKITINNKIVASIVYDYVSGPNNNGDQQNTICIPNDCMYLPMGCVQCEFIGKLRYYLDIRRHKQPLIVDLDPFRSGDDAIVNQINQAILKHPFWKTFDILLECKYSVLHPTHYMLRKNVYTLNVFIQGQLVLSYSSHLMCIIMDTLIKVFIQYRIDLNIPNLHRRKLHMTLPCAFMCMSPTCLGTHTDVKNNLCKV